MGTNPDNRLTRGEWLTIVGIVSGLLTPFLAYLL